MCIRDSSITDIDLDRLEPVKLKGRLPAGFRIEKFNVEVEGVFKACATSVKRH